MSRNVRVDPLRLRFLVLRSQAGDEDAFADLYGSFAERTYRYLTSVVGGLAEDVNQELWLGIYRGLGALADPPAFEAWLFRAARFRAIDHLRRLRLEREFLRSQESSVVGDESLLDVDVESLDAGDLERSLASLNPIHREVIVLRFWEDLRYDEIALIVGCSIGTIRSRLHHAMRHLRQLMTSSQIPSSSEAQ